MHGCRPQLSGSSVCALQSRRAMPPCRAVGRSGRLHSNSPACTAATRHARDAAAATASNMCCVAGGCSAASARLWLVRAHTPAHACARRHRWRAARPPLAVMSSRRCVLLLAQHAGCPHSAAWAAAHARMQQGWLHARLPAATQRQRQRRVHNAERGARAVVLRGREAAAVDAHHSLACARACAAAARQAREAPAIRKLDARLESTKRPNVT